MGLTHIQPILLYNRRRAAIETETVCGLRWMALVYGTRWGRCLARTLLCRPAVSRLYGRWQEHPASRRRIAAFVTRYGVDLTEALAPTEGYRSFNDFFIRRLKPEARPLAADERRLLAPADSRLQVFPISRQSWLRVKGVDLTLTTLLGGRPPATAYEGGWALVFRLAPSDYHRFGYPVAGVQTPVQAVAGNLHSVNPLALRHQADIHFGNQRHWCRIASPGWGNVLQVEVGAMLVGSIVQQRPQGGPVRRGAEKGYFQFGGSTVIVILEPRRILIDDDILTHSRRGIETLVRYGEGVGGLL